MYLTERNITHILLEEGARLGEYSIQFLEYYVVLSNTHSNHLGGRVGGAVRGKPYLGNPCEGLWTLDKRSPHIALRRPSPCDTEEISTPGREQDTGKAFAHLTLSSLHTILKHPRLS